MKYHRSWPRFLFACVTVLLFDLCLSTLARADAQGYRGKYELRTAFKDGPRIIDGKVTTRGPKLRIDYTDRSLGVLILDLAKKSGFILFEDAKRYQDVDLEKMGAPLPICPGEGVSDCLQAAGFVKAGSETVDGRKTDRWEASKARDASGRPLHLSVWIAPAMPDLPYVRLKTQDVDGLVNEHDITRLAKVDAPDELFALPGGYTKPGSPEGTPAAAAAAKD